MFTFFKRPGPALAATSAAGPTPSRLFYVSDRSTGMRFLVDTGAQVSVVPPARTDRRNRQGHFSLQAVNNTDIATYGVLSLSLDLGLRRTFRWVFVIADVKQPILGTDFLCHFGLLVDVRRANFLILLRLLTSAATLLLPHSRVLESCVSRTLANLCAPSCCLSFLL